MKVAYIAHPIGGEIMKNIEDLIFVIRKINLEEPDVIPFVPYIGDVLALNDNDPVERARGIKNDCALLRSGIVNELRLYGNRITPGMWEEIEAARAMKIKIVPMTHGTNQEFDHFQYQTYKI